MLRLRARPLAVLAVLLGFAAAASSRAVVGSVRTEDRNGDGRADVWRTFDEHGQPLTVGIDTNFDGRVDVREYYSHGALIRRDLDRNFDNQIDLVEDFDLLTHEHIRSVVDVDADGTADLLVLFQSGRPVYSRWATPRQTAGAAAAAYDSAPLGRNDSHELAPLIDPFRAGNEVRTTGPVPGSDVCVGLSASGGLPASIIESTTPTAPSARVAAPHTAPVLFTGLRPSAPRGPPVS